MADLGITLCRYKASLKATKIEDPVGLLVKTEVEEAEKTSFWAKSTMAPWADVGTIMKSHMKPVLFHLRRLWQKRVAASNIVPEIKDGINFG